MSTDYAILPGEEELAYAKTPVKSIGELVQFLKIVHGDLGKVTVPRLSYFQ